MFLNPASQQQPMLQMESLPYNTVESLLDDVSNQIANSNMTRRYSRGAPGQRVGGGSMRIVKPSSTSNSPRNSACLSRRRTVMGHAASYRRQLGTMDHNTTAPDVQTQFEGMQAPSRSSRPVSWHPSSQMPSSMYSSAYPIVDYGLSNGFGGYELPMTPAVYSGYTSPASTFSPVSQPYTSYDQPYPYADDSTYFPAVDNTNNNIYTPCQPSSLRQQTIGQEYFGPAPMDESFMYSDFNWANFAANSFNNATAPPTPENFLSSQNVERTFEAEDAIPYHPLEEPEDDGEELIGMGLYDAPEKSPSCDPQLDSYRTSLMQQMFGAAYRPLEPTTTGKGLKLEDAWVPPPSEDGDDEEDADSEDDAEGSPAADDPSDNASGVNDMARAFGKEIDPSVCNSAPIAQQDMYAGWV